MNYRFLIVGDEEHAKYHPLSNIYPSLKELVSDYGFLDKSTDYTVFNNLGNVDILFLYNDCWDESIHSSYSNSILNFVKEGGRIFVLHSGISLASDEYMENLIGASFRGHPEACELGFKTIHNHSITHNVDDFTLFEEPYRYNVSTDLSESTFLYYEHDGCYWISGWTRNYCKGKVINFHPGHNAAVFNNESIKEIIKKSIEWLLVSEKY